jgi:hypothetical protein
MSNWNNAYNLCPPTTPVSVRKYSFQSQKIHDIVTLCMIQTERSSIIGHVVKMSRCMSVIEYHFIIHSVTFTKVSHRICLYFKYILGSIPEYELLYTYIFDWMVWKWVKVMLVFLFVTLRFLEPSLHELLLKITKEAIGVPLRTVPVVLCYQILWGLRSMCFIKTCFN